MLMSYGTKDKLKCMLVLSELLVKWSEKYGFYTSFLVKGGLKPGT